MNDNFDDMMMMLKSGTMIAMTSKACFVLFVPPSLESVMTRIPKNPDFLAVAHLLYSHPRSN